MRAPGATPDKSLTASATIGSHLGSLGKGRQSDRFLSTFDNVEWQPGTLRAVGFDARVRRICEASKETTGEPAALRLTATPAPGGLKADGADIALVEVEGTDAEGRRCPTALNLVAFELSGPAEWRGGIAQGPSNYILAKSLPVECGVNRVLVEADGEKKELTLFDGIGGESLMPKTTDAAAPDAAPPKSAAKTVTTNSSSTNRPRSSKGRVRPPTSSSPSTRTPCSRSASRRPTPRPGTGTSTAVPRWRSGTGSRPRR